MKQIGHHRYTKCRFYVAMLCEDLLEMLCEDHTFATPQSNVAPSQKTVANVRSAVNVWRSSAILHHSLIKNTATLESGCYTLGLETDEVA